jgi:hypothetical protein
METVFTHPCEGFAVPHHRFQTKTLFAGMILPEMKPSQGLDEQLLKTFFGYIIFGIGI